MAILLRWMTDSQDYFFPQSLPLFLSHSLSHTNTNQRTSAITPEITSLIDISITLRHSCVLSCLAHTPPVPILNCSMDAPTKNEVTLLFFFLSSGGASFHRPLSIGLFCVSASSLYVFIRLNVRSCMAGEMNRSFRNSFCFMVQRSSVIQWKHPCVSLTVPPQRRRGKAKRDKIRFTESG